GQAAPAVTRASRPRPRHGGESSGGRGGKSAEWGKKYRGRPCGPQWVLCRPHGGAGLYRGAGGLGRAVRLGSRLRRRAAAGAARGRSRRTVGGVQEHIQTLSLRHCDARRDRRLFRTPRGLSRDHPPDRGGAPTPPPPLPPPPPSPPPP